MKNVSIALAGIIGCAFVQPAAAAEPGHFTERVVYAFAGPPDGAKPEAGLVDVKGTLYGTTFYGGGTGCKRNGCGTVFSLDPDTGAETVLHAFAGRGKRPSSGLIDAEGRLYGTTVAGGAHHKGTVFSINRHTGTEKVLHSFCSQQNCTDGANPGGSLIEVDGVLYGATAKGGDAGYGTVFALDPATGAETVLYSFAGGTDGIHPNGGLVAVDGTLYGTTEGGGNKNYLCPDFGCGTVFAVDMGTGAETVLHSFAGEGTDTDGDFPRAGLIDVDGVLYGTTFYGGGTGCYGVGCGTVFTVDPGSGAETVIYSFLGGNRDGEFPEAGLIDVRGTLYGTTLYGGGKRGSIGGGTVFSLDPATGAEKVVHYFAFCTLQSCTDGDFPTAGLIEVKGTLYGTTSAGGGCYLSYGCGTVFALTKQ